MYGLKAQKLLAQGNGYKQHALKGQKLLAQGNGYKQHALKGQKLLGGCVKTPNIKILNSLCVHLWMRNEFFIFL